MVYSIVEFSKYVILTLMLVYTFHCFYVVRRQNREVRNELLIQQNIITFFMDFVAFLVIYLQTGDINIIIFYVEMMVYFISMQVIYRIFYKKASLLLLNNMCMLLSVGFIMLARLDITTARRQLLIAVGGSVLALVIPIMIRKMKFLKDLTIIYAATGLVLLAAVLLLAQTSYGAKLSLLGVQPSEIIKITFVFYVASVFSRDVRFRQVVIVSLVAALHVGILVLSKDLGSAVIFFITYLFMLYVATQRVTYLALGTAAGCGAAVLAYRLFGHVRQRVTAWQDPMAVYNNEGYQIAQSLFAIGTGGWFGMGLCKGSPKSIPVVKNDFIFSAICEELGGIFAICLILVCLSFYMMILNISLQLKNPFYKLIALGLGTEYAFQVFLTVGGATKFIPMTGVTLPLVSYGGSSVLSTIVMLAIIQGFYIFREDEDEEFERRRRIAIQRARDEEIERATTQPIYYDIED